MEDWLHYLLAKSWTGRRCQVYRTQALAQHALSTLGSVILGQSKWFQKMEEAHYSGMVSNTDLLQEGYP
jgi:hypothetical protein